MDAKPMTAMWTTAETAAYLRLHPVTLRAWRHECRVDQPPYVQVGSAIRYAPGEVARWAEERTRRPGTERKNHGPSRRNRRPGPQ